MSVAVESEDQPHGDGRRDSSDAASRPSGRAAGTGRSVAHERARPEPRGAPRSARRSRAGRCGNQGSGRRARRGPRARAARARRSTSSAAARVRSHAAVLTFLTFLIGIRLRRHRRSQVSALKEKLAAVERTRDFEEHAGARGNGEALGWPPNAAARAVAPTCAQSSCAFQQRGPEPASRRRICGTRHVPSSTIRCRLPRAPVTRSAPAERSACVYGCVGDS